MNNSGIKLDKNLMKISNRRLVFSIIHGRGPISRVQIAKLINMSSMSVGKITDGLVNLGLVTEEEIIHTTSAGLGRRPKMLRVASDNLLCIGVEMDRDGVFVGIVNFHGQVVRKKSIRHDLYKDKPETVLKYVSDLIKEIIDENSDLPITPAVGIACPGLINVETGTIKFSSQLKWRDVNVVDILRKYTGIDKIVIDNEVKARGIAEDLFGVAKNSSNTVVLNVGSGIGSSVVINHQIHRGASNLAGEIGHICINPTGSMCECGRRGCLQTYIADWAILKDARAVKPDATLDTVFDAYQYGESWAVNLIDCVVKYVSITISILANTYAPDEIILCGRLIDNYKILRDVIFENYKSQLNDYIMDSFKLKTSEFGSEGTVIGAGTLAFYHLMDDFFEK